MSGLRAWWAIRSPREQRLLLAMIILILILIAWIGVLRPLDRALADARERHGRAVIALVDARAQRGAPTGARLAGPIAAYVERSAGEAGFALARLAATAPGTVEITIDAARPPALFGWLERMAREQGVTVEQFAARANADRTIGARITLGGGAR